MADEKKAPSLAEKLNDDLANLISGMKPRTTQEAWPEDKWEEEMEKHPFFMSKPPEEGAELPELVEAMQSLKYDPNLNSPEELAQSFKDEGNHYFKLKKYKYAIISYSEALKQQCSDEELNAIIHSNRAAAHFHLGNIQKALKDSVEAVNKKADHVKAIHRAAECSLKLKNFDDCISWCEKGLEVPDSGKFKELFRNLIKEAAKSQKLANRNERKARFLATNELKVWRSVMKAIKERGMNCDMGKNDAVPDWWTDENTMANSKVHQDEEGSLIWPVLLMYPEYNVTDFIQLFHEGSCFEDHLKSMFDSDNEPSWDQEHKYKLDKLKVYYENKGDLILVDKSEKLQNILSDKRYKVRGGLPSFFVTVADSSFDRFWLSKGFTSD